jgi:acetylornithine deacetylase
MPETQITEVELTLHRKNAISLLKKLIEIPSYSLNEEKRADYLSAYLKNRGVCVTRIKNNLICVSKNFNKKSKILMLNSHIDTVKESDSYTKNPFEPEESEGKIYGLGSNDAGASVVSLIETFLHFEQKAENIMLVLTAEEECSGKEGMDAIVNYFETKAGYRPEYVIIGEPTGMKVAIGEHGLLVIDAFAKGISGHAARNDGVNALYKAIDDINMLRNYKFGKHSELMGDVKMTVTIINSGYAHNVIPDKCTFTIDIRPTDVYTNSEIYEELQQKVSSTLKPRNLSNRTSSTPKNSSLIQCAIECGVEQYISPTTSDWMRINYPSIKMGPGESARSHKADEYIFINEIEEAIKKYIIFINTLCNIK